MKDYQAAIAAVIVPRGRGGKSNSVNRESKRDRKRKGRKKEKKSSEDRESESKRRNTGEVFQSNADRKRKR